MSDGPYTLRFEELSDGWTRASVAEHPEIAAEAPTRIEAREMTLIALMGSLQANGDLKPVPPTSRRAA